MKNNLSISILLLFSFFTLLTTCEKEVPLVVEEKEQKLAVLCNFSPGEPFSIELSKSISLFSPNSGDNTINSADITICSDAYCANAMLEPNTIPSNSKTNYKLSDDLILPESEKTYTIKIDMDGFPTLTGKSTVPKPAQITHTSLGAVTRYSISEFDSIQGYDVRLALQFLDDQSQENFYQVNFYQTLSVPPPPSSISPSPSQDSTTKTLPNQGFSLIDNQLTGDFNLIDGDGGILFKDKNFQKSFQEFVFEPRFFFDKASKPVEIIIELRTVSKEYYNYYTSIYRQTSQGTNVPFSDPTVIHSNIRNGLGIFAGYSTDRIKTDIEF